MGRNKAINSGITKKKRAGKEKAVPSAQPNHHSEVSGLLAAAACDGNFILLQTVCEQYGLTLNDVHAIRLNEGQSVYHIAAVRGKLPLIINLITLTGQTFDFLLSHTMHSGATVLHLLASAGKLKECWALAHRIWGDGAQQALLTHRDHNHNSIFHWAAKKGWQNVLTLASGLGVTNVSFYTNQNRNTPMDACITHTYQQLQAKFPNATLDMTIPSSALSQEAVMSTTMNKHSISHAALRGTQWEKMLLYAAETGALHMLLTLCECTHHHGIAMENLPEIRFENHESVFHIAAKHGHFDFINGLLAQGNLKADFLASHTTAKGATVLHLLAGRGDSAHCLELNRKICGIRTTLRDHASFLMDHRDGTGNSIFHYAAHAGIEALCTIAPMFDADLNDHVNMDGKTPMQVVLDTTMREVLMAGPTLPIGPALPSPSAQPTSQSSERLDFHSLMPSELV